MHCCSHQTWKASPCSLLAHHVLTANAQMQCYKRYSTSRRSISCIFCQRQVSNVWLKVQMQSCSTLECRSIHQNILQPCQRRARSCWCGALCSSIPADGKTCQAVVVSCCISLCAYVIRTTTVSMSVSAAWHPALVLTSASMLRCDILRARSTRCLHSCLCHVAKPTTEHS